MPESQDHFSLEASRRRAEFTALSRELLVGAGRGAARLEFLRHAGDCLLRFSKCDRIWIRVKGQADYCWFATSDENSLPRFESFDGHGNLFADQLADACAPSDTPGVGETHLDAQIWTATESKATILPTGGECGGEIRSLLYCPIRVEPADDGYMLLADGDDHHFTDAEIEYYTSIGQLLSLALTDRRALASLRERVKELGCLYQITQIELEPGLSLDQRLDRIVRRLPEAWQFSESAVARIELDGRSFVTGRFLDTYRRQSVPVEVDGKVRGRVEVAYSDDCQIAIGDPFLTEEQSLIDAVAREVSLLVERQELQQRRSVLEEQLRHADRLALIGKLAAGVAHEINEPLSSILGFTQLLAQGTHFSDEQRSDLDRIIAASLHAREIVRKLVLFARQQPITRQALSLNRIIDEAMTMLSPQRSRAGIAFEMTLQSDLPEIMGDPVHLRQVVMNLVLNAIQATSDGGTVMVATAIADRAVQLSVADTGVGIPAESLGEIFTPFYTTKEIGEGTGLGLAVVHGIVTAHGGTIDVESTPGSGTRFCVRLPLGGDGSSVAGTEDAKV